MALPSAVPPRSRIRLAGRQRADEHHAAEVQGLAQAGEGRHRPPLPRGHGPPGQLLGRERAVPQAREVARRPGRIGLAAPGRARRPRRARPAPRLRESPRQPSTSRHGGRGAAQAPQGTFTSRHRPSSVTAPPLPGRFGSVPSCPTWSPRPTSSAAPPSATEVGGGHRRRRPRERGMDGRRGAAVRRRRGSARGAWAGRRTSRRRPGRSAPRSRPSGAMLDQPGGAGRRPRSSRCRGPPGGPCSPSPAGTIPSRADTAGVGQLLLGARDAGAAGSSSAVAARPPPTGARVRSTSSGSPAALAGIELVVACDVTTPFTGPRPGSSAPRRAPRAEQVEAAGPSASVDWSRRATGGTSASTSRRARCRRRRGPGRRAGRTRGAHRARVRLRGRRDRPGRSAWTGPTWSSPARATWTHRPSRARWPGACSSWPAPADGRGRPLPVLCIAGGVDRAVLVAPPAGMQVVSLTARFGRVRARGETLALIGQVTAGALSRFCP